MSEPEKKGSAWPWIAVPVAAVSVFFLLRECQHRLPPAQPAGQHAAPDVAAPEPATPEPAAPEAAPAPQ